jgi:uncharacterized protein with FMN-binding domain
MRKVLLALLLTAVGLGLLLSFKSRPATGATTALGKSALSGAGESAVSPQTSPSASSTGPAPTPTATSAAPSSPQSSSSSPSSPASSKKASSGAKSGSFTGAAENTEFGPVQVEATVSGGKLTDVSVLQVPDRGGYEQQIVQIALPELKSEALSAQSANIDVVSGATYTSQGYAESLQSALDQAGL